MSSIVSRPVAMIFVTLLLGMALPSTAAMTWLQLDDPPAEGAGDSVMTTVFSDGFEAGTLVQWTEGGALKWQAAGNRRHSGAWSSFVNGGGGGSSTMTSLAIDVSNSNRRNVSFWWQLSAGTPNLRIALHINDGVLRSDVWVKRTADADSTWHKAVVDLTPYAASTTLRLVFEFSSPSGSDKGWIDDLLVARNHPSADMVDLFYSNDGIYLYLRETLAAGPDTNRYTYLITIDKPTDGAAIPDYRVVYTKGVSSLDKWNVSVWENVAAVQVTPGAANITFLIPLSALANPDLLQDTDLYFANLVGIVPSPSPAAFANPPSPPPGADHAADQGVIHIPRNNVPEIPLWPTLPVFLAALAAVVLLGSRRFGLWGRGGRVR